MRALAAALLLVVACDKPAPVPLKIRYAAKTDNAPDGTNNTYFSIVEDEALFVVADARDPDASKRAVEALEAAFAKECSDLTTDLRVRCAVGRTHGSSIAAVAIEGNVAHVASFGRVTVLLRHDYTLAPGDSLVLVNRGLLDGVGEARVRAAMPDAPSGQDALAASVARLLDDSKAARKPSDPATAILVQVVTTAPRP